MWFVSFGLSPTKMLCLILKHHFWKPEAEIIRSVTVLFIVLCIEIWVVLTPEQSTETMSVRILPPIRDSNLPHLEEQNLLLFIVEFSQQFWINVHITQYLFKHSGWYCNSPVWHLRNVNSCWHLASRCKSTAITTTSSAIAEGVCDTLFCWNLVSCCKAAWKIAFYKAWRSLKVIGIVDIQ